MTDELAAEFVGGPVDGVLRMVPSEPCGLPMRLVRVAEFNPASLFDPRDLGPTYRVIEYERGVISEDTHRWHYHYRGSR